MVIGWYAMANFSVRLLYAWYVNISAIYGG